MTAEKITGFKEKFAGQWKVDRSECFEDFLSEVGVNYFVRKMASLARPATNITVEDEKITISFNAGFVTKSDTFKLNEEFETEHQGGAKAKVLATYENGVLTMDNKPLDDKVKPQKTTREIVGDEMLLTMYISKVVCKRYFKRIPQ